jgi:hypothetical protein
MKNKNETDYIMIILILLGVILLLVGISYEIPNVDIQYVDAYKYVGGDAYNYIIEASLRGGTIAGCKAAKALYICSGLIIFSLGMLRINIKNK